MFPVYPPPHRLSIRFNIVRNGEFHVNYTTVTLHLFVKFIKERVSLHLFSPHAHIGGGLSEQDGL